MDNYCCGVKKLLKEYFVKLNEDGLEAGLSRAGPPADVGGRQEAFVHLFLTSHDPNPSEAPYRSF